MAIQLLHTTDCHVWEEALRVLKEVLQESGVKDEVQVVTITAPDEAKSHKFLGSPTVLIDGIDIDPRAQKLTNYSVASCRSYVFNNKFYEYPPKEMIKKALK